MRLEPSHLLVEGLTPLEDLELFVFQLPDVLAQVVDVGAQDMLMGQGVGRLVLCHDGLDGLDSLFEGGARFGGIEDAEAHFLPQVGLVLPAYKSRRALKFFAANPELAIERHFRKTFAKPVRRVELVADWPNPSQQRIHPRI